MKKRKSTEAKAIVSHNLPMSYRGEGPNPIDIHVGNKLRVRRIILGLSQDELGEAVGITFQQLQKYERGTNRISASRLYLLSHVLDVPVDYFFEGFHVSAKGKGSHFNTAKIESNPLENPDVLELVRAYQLIPPGDVRRRALSLIRVLAGTDGEEK